MAETDRPKLTVFQQALRVMARWPGTVQVVQRPETVCYRFLGRAETVLVDVLVWIGKLTPTVISPTYTVELTFTDGNSTADVQVLDPVLDPGLGDELPHVYTNTAGLCLHENDQWDQSMPIATTLIPWTAEWLAHYELWKATGVWTGGGATHSQPIRPAGGRRLTRVPR